MVCGWVGDVDSVWRVASRNDMCDAAFELFEVESTDRAATGVRCGPSNHKQKGQRQRHRLPLPIRLHIPVLAVVISGPRSFDLQLHARFFQLKKVNLSVTSDTRTNWNQKICRMSDVTEMSSSLSRRRSPVSEKHATSRYNDLV